MIMAGFDPMTFAADTAGGLLSYGLNQISASKQFKRQKQLMDKQNKMNQQNWHMQNAYNTPKAQMERLAAAGLNPDLMYNGGAGALQSGEMSSVSQGSASMAAPAPDMSSLGTQAVNAELTKSNVEKNMNEIDKIQLENKMAFESFGVRMREMASKANLAEAQVSEIGTHISLMESQIGQIHAAEYELWQRGKVQEETRKNLEKDGLLKDQQLRWNEILSRANYEEIISKAKLNEEQRQQIREMLPGLLESQRVDIELKKFELKMRNRYGEVREILGCVNDILSGVGQVLGGYGLLRNSMRPPTPRITNNYVNSR